MVRIAAYIPIMSASPSYVITLGTTPLPRGIVSGRRARRGGRHVVRVSGGTAVIFATTGRAPGAHRAGRAAHRAHVIVDPSGGPGRHRVVRRFSARTAIVRSALPTLLVLAVAALFLTAWFSASDAVAFASIVQP
jgi:hypothetical protein